MKKSILSSLAVAALGALCAINLAAQNSKVNVTVPFDFSVDANSFPAGDYTVSFLSDHVILIGGAGQPRKFVLATSVSSPSREGSASLVFHRYGSAYYLWRVWAGDTVGRELPVSKSERELIAKGRHEAPVTLYAGK